MDGAQPREARCWGDDWVGGTFNFIAGKVKRAPKWMQRCGLEWIYRILQEPGRLWRRYAYGLFKFSWLSFRALLGGFR